MFLEIHSEGSDKLPCPVMEGDTACNTGSWKQAGLPLQEPSNNSRCFPSSSTHTLTSHPFRAGLQEPVLSQGSIARISSDSHPFPQAGCQETRWQETSSAIKPPLPTPRLPYAPLWAAKHKRLLSFFQSPSTYSQDASSQKPSALAGARPSCGFTRAHTEAPADTAPRQGTHRSFCNLTVQLHPDLCILEITCAELSPSSSNT